MRKLVYREVKVKVKLPTVSRLLSDWSGFELKVSASCPSLWIGEIDIYISI